MAKHHKITLFSASIYLSKKSSEGKKLHLVDLNFGPNLTEDFEKKLEKKKIIEYLARKSSLGKKIHLVNLDFDPNLTKDSELKKRKKKKKKIEFTKFNFGPKSRFLARKFKDIFNLPIFGLNNSNDVKN